MRRTDGRTPSPPIRPPGGPPRHAAHTYTHIEISHEPLGPPRSDQRFESCVFLSLSFWFYFLFCNLSLRLASIRVCGSSWFSLPLSLSLSPLSLSESFCEPCFVSLLYLIWHFDFEISLCVFPLSLGSSGSLSAFSLSVYLSFSQNRFASYLEAWRSGLLVVLESAANGFLPLPYSFWRPLGVAQAHGAQEHRAPAPATAPASSPSPQPQPPAQMCILGLCSRLLQPGRAISPSGLGRSSGRRMFSGTLIGFGLARAVSSGGRRMDSSRGLRSPQVF